MKTGDALLRLNADGQFNAEPRHGYSHFGVGELGPVRAAAAYALAFSIDEIERQIARENPMLCGALLVLWRAACGDPIAHVFYGNSKWVARWDQGNEMYGDTEIEAVSLVLIDLAERSN